jgi:hypothetical protein
VLDVARRILQLLIGERAVEPVGETVSLRDSYPQLMVEKVAERGTRVAHEARGDLGVEQGRRGAPTGQLENLEILTGGMDEGGAVPGQDVAEGRDVDGERVDEDDVVGPGQLHEGKLWKVGLLPVELGVETDERLVGEGVENVGEVVVVLDGSIRQADPAPRSTGCPASIQPIVPPATLVAWTPCAARNSTALALRPPILQMT